MQASPVTKDRKRELLAQIRRFNCGVVSTVDAQGNPEAAFISLAVTENFEIVFETLTTSRKYLNIQERMKAALVIGWDEGQTFQIEGVADEPVDWEKDELKKSYYSACPENAGHRDWPDMTYIRVRPRWIRYSNYGSPWSVEEHTFDV